MADHYRVLIDLPKLAANVAAAEGKPVTAGDAYQLLVDHDFIPQPGGYWLCEEISLRFLAESEITQVVLVPVD